MSSEDFARIKKIGCHFVTHEEHGNGNKVRIGAKHPGKRCSVRGNLIMRGEMQGWTPDAEMTRRSMDLREFPFPLRPQPSHTFRNGTARE